MVAFFVPAVQLFVENTPDTVAIMQRYNDILYPKCVSFIKQKDSRVYIPSIHSMWRISLNSRI
jgi:hypothetical protein